MDRHDGDEDNAALKNPEEYLQLIQERNRLLSKIKKKEEERRKKIADREKGFNVYFRGANDEVVNGRKTPSMRDASPVENRPASRLKRDISPRPFPSTSASIAAPSPSITAKAATPIIRTPKLPTRENARQRKTWTKDEVFIPAQEGIRLKPPASGSNSPSVADANAANESISSPTSQEHPDHEDTSSQIQQTHSTKPLDSELVISPHTSHVDEQNTQHSPHDLDHHASADSQTASLQKPTLQESRSESPCHSTHSGSDISPSHPHQRLSPKLQSSRDQGSTKKSRSHKSPEGSEDDIPEELHHSLEGKKQEPRNSIQQPIPLVTSRPQTREKPVVTISMQTLSGNTTNSSKVPQKDTGDDVMMDKELRKAFDAVAQENAKLLQGPNRPPSANSASHTSPTPAAKPPSRGFRFPGMADTKIEATKEQTKDQVQSSSAPPPHTDASSNIVAPVESQPAVTNPKHGPIQERSDTRPSTSAAQHELLQQISGKLSGLDPRKQKFLLRVLENLESTDTKDMESTKQLDTAFISTFLQLAYKDENPAVIPSIPELSPSKLKPSPIKTSAKPRASSSHTFVFQILSTWGHRNLAGLTEIDFYDDDGPIPIEDSDLQLLFPGGTKNPLTRLIDGKTKTNNERHMWTCIFGEDANRIDLQIKVESSNVKIIKVWNFNKSMVDAIKGVRELKIFHEGRRIWHGDVTKGSGNEIFDYSTTIVQPEDGWMYGEEYVPLSLSPQTSVGKAVPGEAPRSPSSRKAAKSVKDTSRSIDPPNKAESSNQKMMSSKTLDFTEVQPGKESEDRNVPSKSDSKRDTPGRNQQQGSKRDTIPSPSSETTSTLKRSSSNRPNSNLNISDVSTIPEFARGDSRASSNMDAPHSHRSDEGNESSIPSWLSETPAVVKKKEPTSKAMANASQQKPARAPSAGRERVPLQAAPKTSSHSTNSSESQAQNAMASRNTSNVAAKGRRASPSAHAQRPDFTSPTVVDKSPDKLGPKRDTNETKRSHGLDQMLDSLSAFSMKHLGRLGSLKENAEAPNIDDFLQSLAPAPLPLAQKVAAVANQPLSKATLSSSRVFDHDPFGVDDLLKSNSIVTSRIPIFDIPVLPTGRKLKIEIMSTWGDQFYVGMTGLDIFDSAGKPVRLNNVFKQVRADPPDINILPEFGQDPRTVDKLFDGVNGTCDDCHMWLAPFKDGQPNYVYVDFGDSVTVSMLRLWNYNKSRIHSQRGVRDVVIKFDERIVFKGEIRQASGELHDADSCAEVILFTLDDSILSAIEMSDSRYHKNMLAQQVVGPQNVPEIVRPLTAGQTQDLKQIQTRIKPYLEAPGRPVTSVVTKAPPPLAFGPKINMPSGASFPSGRVLRIEFLTTWGDLYYLGLTGIQIFDGEGNLINLNAAMLSAQPKDLNELPGSNSDVRTLDKLVNNQNLTTDIKNMWMIPYKSGSRHVLAISLLKPTKLGALKIWNYNKSPDDSFRGAQRVRIYLDDKMISSAEGVILRKAPGHADFDFGQLIFLHRIGETLVGKLLRSIQEKTNGKGAKNHNDLILQDYETQLFPIGYTLKFVFSSTWGDLHYLGLNGLELFDLDGKPICITPDMCHATPRDVTLLPELAHDLRTLDKLFDGTNDTFNDEHMWLTPFSSDQDVTLYIFFNEPVSLSMIRIWNYSKTPARGANDVDISLDDMLIFKGQIRPAPTLASRRNGVYEFACSVLFTNDATTLEQERTHTYTNRRKERDVAFYNDQELVIASVGTKAQAAPKTSAPHVGVGGGVVGQQMAIGKQSLAPQNLVRPSTSVVGNRR
eukprot:TRINITY_DN10545_c0_g1_i1.p1 TRINITY_DN10545_c0_g1~~TRINITY_DN10545_c0_g1_i1.p1  ORF type:complete len:1785 (+),score=340.31 TRINITY_DN10545_c0_g1_i1:93-5447(+)